MSPSIKSLLVAYARQCSLLLSLNRPKEALPVIDQVMLLQDRNVLTTLKGKAQMVSAGWWRSRILVILNRIDEAEFAAENAVDLATEYFASMPDYARGQYQLMNAWAELINVVDRQNKPARFLEIAPRYYSARQNYLRLKPGKDSESAMNDYLAWAIRLEALNLARLGRWDEAVSTAERILEVQNLQETGNRPRFREAALGISRF